MSARRDELPERTEIALITFGDPERLEQYNRSHSYGFPILTDPDRSTYRAYGLGRGTATRIWGLRAARRYLELARRDTTGPFGLVSMIRFLRSIWRPTDDTMQLGGDFVIGPDGRLTYGFWGEGPDDRPTVDALIAATRSCMPAT